MVFCTGEQKGMQQHVKPLLPFRHEQLTSSVMISYSNTTDTEQDIQLCRVKTHQTTPTNTTTGRARNDRDKTNSTFA